VVSAVTLFFAYAVKGTAQGNVISNGIFLAGFSFFFSFSFSSPTLSKEPRRATSSLIASFLLVFFFAQEKKA
jgi:hypothetical protein